MKRTLYDFFVWAAGSDREVLDRCGQSEHVKHAGYGGLVLIPAVLGLFSMLYAVSTLTDKWYVYTAAGITWAIIVFIFDRFIVSTFRKSDSPSKDIRSFLFASRLLFSIGIGIVVSHPTVLLVFDDSLEQELLEMKAEGEKAVFDKYEAEINIIRARDSVLNSEVLARLEERRCKETLLLFEMSGKDTTLTCGTTSGMLQYGPRSREIKEEITYLSQEIQKLQERTAEKSAKNRAEIEQLQKEKDEKIAQFRTQFSTNYLAREIALERLMDKEIGGDTVKWTMWFLILFFILIDILPVSFKAATKPGLYDRLLSGESDVELESTPAYERGQEDKVRKFLIDQMASRRKRDISTAVQRLEGPFPELKNHLEDYVNVQVPYHYGVGISPGEQSTAENPKVLQAFIVRSLQLLLFAVAQTGVVFLLTRDVFFLGWFFLVLWLCNIVVDQVVRYFTDKSAE